MDKECKRQVDELNKLWHHMLIESNYKDIEAKYLRIQALSTNEIAILRIISEKEEVIIKDILEILNLPKSTLTSIIDRLENRNLIVRAISKRDRRSYKLELTEEGKITQDEHIKFEEEKEFLSAYTKQAEAGQIVDLNEMKAAYIEKVGHSIGGSQIYRMLERHGWRKVMPRSKHPQKANSIIIVYIIFH